MYFFVPYNISEIQKSIQAGHSSLEYARRFANDEEFIDFVDNHKTSVILNGGTTNDERDLDGKALGTLNQLGDSLNDNEIKFSYFREPDLNNSLTALCFIVDERVFNRKDYPDFSDYLFNVRMRDDDFENQEEMDNFIYDIENTFKEFLIEKYQTRYKEWIRFIGGVKNEFLRDLIKDKKLA